MRRIQIVLSAVVPLAAIALFGCGGSGGGTGTTGATGTGAFSMQVSSPQPMNNNNGAVTHKRPGFADLDTALFTITVQGKSGFAGTVNVSVANPNTNLFTTKLQSSSVTLSAANETATDGLLVFLNTATTTIGNQNFTVKAQEGSTTQTGIATVVLQTANSGFSISSTPLSSQIGTLAKGDCWALYDVSVTTDDLAYANTDPEITISTVGLDASKFSVETAEDRVAVDDGVSLGNLGFRTDIWLEVAANGSVAPANGTYQFLITATDGHFLYSVPASVVVAAGTPSYQVNGSPSAQTFSSATGPATLTYNVTVSSLNGFAGTVNLSNSNADLPAGLTVAFGNSSVTVPANGSATTTMTVTLTGAATPAGNYFAFMHGTSGSLSASDSVKATVP